MADNKFNQELKLIIESEDSISNVINDLVNLGLEWCGFDNTVLDNFVLIDNTPKLLNKFFTLHVKCDVITDLDDKEKIKEVINKTFEGGNSVIGYTVNKILKYNILKI